MLFTINDASPTVAITAPSAYSSFLSNAAGSLTATGTASDANGITGVTVRLYRKALGGNSAGYRDGASFDATLQSRSAPNGSQCDRHHERDLELESTGLRRGCLLSGRHSQGCAGNYKAVRVSFTVDDVPPTLNINTPINDSTSANAPVSATGTAEQCDRLCCCYALYRYNTGGNMPGWWDGNSLTTPVFAATNSNSASLPGASKHWHRLLDMTRALPTLRPGQYRLYMRGTNDLSTRANKSMLFTVNDASPTVEITAPASGSRITQGTLSTATGTAGDADGIAGVTVRLYRKVGAGNTAGYWNFICFDATYNVATHERAATNTGTGFSTWEF